MGYLEQEIILKAVPPPKRARDYRELVDLLWSERRMIGRAVMLAMAGALIVALLIRNKYESTIRILPPESNNGLMGLAAMLGGGKDSPALAAASQMFGVKSSGALAADVLRGRTIQDALVNKFDLRRQYWTKYYTTARKELETRTEISEDKKSGVISIAVLDESPDQAQSMAREYVTQLNHILSKISTSAAGRERAFIEKRLGSVKEEMDQAELQMSSFQTRTGTIELEQQTKAMVDSTAKLQAELITAQAEVEALEQIYSPTNVRVRSAQARVEELRRSLDKLVGPSGPQAIMGNPSIDLKTSEIAPPIHRLPNIAVQYVNLYRDLKVRQAVFELLTQQYEMAKIQEAKDTETIRIVDDAAVPEKKSSPPRTIIVLGTGLMMCILAAFYFVTRDKVSQLSSDQLISKVWVYVHRIIGRLVHKVTRSQETSDTGL
jgi:uncharacterized protein involved in exopolysaccharide biosynthesis